MDRSICQSVNYSVNLRVNLKLRIIISRIAAVISNSLATVQELATSKNRLT